jgi:ketopantoate reductase
VAVQRAEQERKAAEAALQQEKAAVPAGSAEHKYLVAKQKANIEAALVVLKAIVDCRLGHASASEECDRFYQPRMRAIHDEADLIAAQLERVDECRKVYRSTIDKKMSDLTVRESTAVKACQALGLYPLEMPAKEKE